MRSGLVKNEYHLVDLDFDPKSKMCFLPASYPLPLTAPPSPSISPSHPNHLPTLTQPSPQPPTSTSPRHLTLGWESRCAAAPDLSVVHLTDSRVEMDEDVLPPHPQCRILKLRRPPTAASSSQQHPPRTLRKKRRHDATEEEAACDQSDQVHLTEGMRRQEEEEFLQAVFRHDAGCSTEHWDESR